jgi:cytochrome c oxidase subunit IV
MAHLSSVSRKNMAHHSSVRPKNMAHEEGQQHPIKLYLVIWGWLFVLSTCSYLVDFFGIHGYLRWSLILLFMIVKAGLIVAIFMHMAWERLALMYAILVPPGAVLLFVAIMAFESDYTHVTRVLFFGTTEASAQMEAVGSQKTSGAEPKLQKEADRPLLPADPVPNSPRRQELKSHADAGINLVPAGAAIASPSAGAATLR